jgi:hypothetical protein
VYFIGATTLIIGIGSMASAFEFLSESASEVAGYGIASLCPGLFFGLLGAFVVTNGVRGRRIRLELREFGVLLSRPPVESKILWDDVAELKIAVLWPGGWSERIRYTLVAKDGQRLDLEDDMENFGRIRAVTEAEIVRRHMPPAIESLEAGRTVSFGPYELTKSGVRHRGKGLAWRDVRGAALVRGIVAVGSRSDGIRVLPKREGVMAWATEKVDDVPTAPVMLALATRLCKGARA